MCCIDVFISKLTPRFAVAENAWVEFQHFAILHIASPDKVNFEEAKIFPGNLSPISFEYFAAREVSRLICIFENATRSVVKL